jgi:hypothetical protein
MPDEPEAFATAKFERNVPHGVELIRTKAVRSN